MDNEVIIQEIGKIKKENPFISSKDLAYQVIINQIIHRNMQSGERVIQDSLAEVMHISRSPVREALMKLEEDGFLEKNDKNVYVVSGIRLKDYVDYSEMRLRMESYAASLAVQNMTEDILQKLKHNIEQYAKTQNIEQARKLDEEFHQIIIQVSDNAYIIDFSKKTAQRKAYYSRYLVQAENLAAARVDHERIYNAMCKYDKNMAEESMKIHLSNYLNKLYEVM